MSTGDRAPRILVLSFYYPPDLSACSFRVAALVQALVRLLPADAQVQVITTQPNRYDTFSATAPSLAGEGTLSVQRLEVPAHKSGMLDQARAFMVFARAVERQVKNQDYSLVFATSSRLMTAALGARIATRLHVPLYLDIRDIFADTIKDVLPRGVALVLGPFVSAIERWTIRRAAHVNLVSQGFHEYFHARYPQQSLSYYTNAVDEEFAGDIGAKGRAHIAGNPIRVLYAGNIGAGQGLHEIIPALAQRLNGQVTFRLIGDGGRRSQLEAVIAQAQLENVEVVNPMSRTALIKEYQDADVLFLHLNDYDAFRKVLPSKIFEYAALGKPIWAGVSGHAAGFLAREVSNVAVFPPCDPEEAVRAFKLLEIRDTPRPEFAERHARKTIMDAMAGDIVALAVAT